MATTGSGNGDQQQDDLFWAETESTSALSSSPASPSSRTDEGDVPSEPPPTTSSSPADPSNPPWLRGYAIAASTVIIILLIGLVLVVASTRNDGDKDDATRPDGASTEDKPRVWPSTLGGRPPAFGERDSLPAPQGTTIDPGVSLWNDFDGWHLWVVPGPGVQDVKGKIATDSEPSRASSAVEGQGSVLVQGNDILFDFTGVTAPIVGIEFNAPFANRVEVSAEGTDGPLPAGTLFTGAQATPVTNPIIVETSVR